MTDKPKVLTDRQKAFLEHLFSDAEGDYRKARDLAGYPPTQSYTEIAKALSSEILELARMELVMNSPKATKKLTGLLANPSEASAMNSLKIINSILDRVGVAAPKDDLNLKIPSGGLFIMPAKEKLNIEEVTNEVTVSTEEESKNED